MMVSKKNMIKNIFLGVIIFLFVIILLVVGIYIMYSKGVIGTEDVIENVDDIICTVKLYYEENNNEPVYQRAFWVDYDKLITGAYVSANKVTYWDIESNTEILLELYSYDYDIGVAVFKTTNGEGFSDKRLNDFWPSLYAIHNINEVDVGYYRQGKYYLEKARKLDYVYFDNINNDYGIIFSMDNIKEFSPVFDEYGRFWGMTLRKNSDGNIYGVARNSIMRLLKN